MSIITTRTPPPINWRKSEELKVVASAALSQLQDMWPKTHALGVQWLLTLVNAGEAVVYGARVCVGKPATLEEATQRTHALAQQFIRECGEMLMTAGPEDPNDKTLSIEIPVDGDFRKWGEGMQYLLKERKDLF